jgi:uncharacterized membrane protein YidH (DUF202 family)
MGRGEMSNELPDLPEAVHRSIEGKDSGTAATLLAVHRNRLAMRQSGLAELRAQLSNETTHLAYLRMAISLVVFGISLNQFSQFLQDEKRTGDGVWLFLRNAEYAGSGMVLLGLLVSVWSLYRYWHVRQAIRHGRYRSLDTAVVVLSLLLIIPASVTAFWIFVR